ncbi:arsenate reductase ArsC [Cupriavidus sp. IDO]|uniref:arsenate reductase ArsC n=1 Tax=Cupriavidus sp. IDO TaxID=1539142 RepID=UPI0005794457|nr:arsenate reductase ArsC [Cupriavidus sp. IDO]KWR74681.1 arsenate reductase [Cupriavidus sp. IDO]
MSKDTYNVLFLCTGNTSRSIMSEALLATMGHGRFKTFSAGSQPSGKVNPFAIEQVKKTGYDLSNLRSKSWDEFAKADAPHMDFIITVCDQAAGEVCPFWPGHPSSAHWGFYDPAAVGGPDETKRAAFEQVFQQIKYRVEAFLQVPLEDLDETAIRTELQRVGDIDVAGIGAA